MILEVNNLHAYYGQSHILHGVDLNVDGAGRAAADYNDIVHGVASP